MKNIKRNKKKTINKYKRYQSGLLFEAIFPKKEGICSCGCGVQLKGRQRRWASKKCSLKALVEFKIIKGDNKYIREELFKRDKGVCSKCKEFDEKWEADHIIEVVNGGGGCGLNNFQTLCQNCHKIKTKNLKKNSKKFVKKKKKK